MNHEEVSPTYKAAQEKVHAALQELANQFGPRVCIHGDWSDCEECEIDQTQVVDDAMLSEFIVVASWTSMDSGRSHMTFITAPNQLDSHTNGLLFTALHQ